MAIINDPSILNAISQWLQAKREAKYWQEREMLLRKSIVFESGIFNPEKEKGTENVELPDGYKLKSVKKINFTLASEDKVRDALEFITPEIRSDIVKWSARLSESAYAKLGEQDKSVIDEVLTTKPGSPELELVEPKKD